MKITRQFEAEDGTLFPTRREAIAHEERLRIGKLLAGLNEGDVDAALSGENEALADALVDAAKIVRAGRKGGE